MTLQNATFKVTWNTIYLSRKVHITGVIVVKEAQLQPQGNCGPRRRCLIMNHDAADSFHE